jgi:hypothetical protein
MKNLKYRCEQWLEKKPLKSLHVWDVENRRTLSESGAEGAAAGGVATASPPHFWLSQGLYPC